jgi:hypothetical protein
VHQIAKKRRERDFVVDKMVMGVHWREDTKGMMKRERSLGVLVFGAELLTTINVVGAPKGRLLELQVLEVYLC